MPVDVLAVCTGNLCRSPIIETLLGARVPGLTVSSAGTGAPEGTPWHPLAVETLADCGHDVTGVARRLRARDVVGASLILTAEAVQRGVVVGLDRTAEQRCFTVLEAQRLLELSPVDGPVGAAGLARHLSTALATFPLERDDDLPDPLRGTKDDFRLCRERVEDAIKTIAPALERPGGPRPTRDS